MLNYGEEEHLILRAIPRNLSYVEDSYLDEYSVSADFVKRSNLHARDTGVIRGLMRKTDMSQAECWCRDGSEKLVSDTEESISIVKRDRCYSSDAGSEEGIFVNQMEDFDSVESGNGRSSCSDLSNDSINTPEEDDLEKTSEGRALSLKELLGRGFKETAMDQGPKLATLRVELNTTEGGAEARSAADGRHSLMDLVHLCPGSPIYEDDEFNFNKAELRKSTSLKTKKTPPGTPSTKKMVRFADAMGLDLESVRHILNIDAPPKIPASAMADLKTGLEEDRKEQGRRYLDVCFGQPGAAENFHQKVMANKVSLENCLITNLSITGIVRVANIGFHKAVRIRYTVNSWITFYDIMASYVQNSCDGPTDRFSFTIVAPAEIGPGGKLEFAVSYTVNDVIYWDSNDGHNYCVVCYAKTTPTEAETAWMHFL